MIAYELKYPVGEFESPEQINKHHLDNWTDTINDFPEKLESEVGGLKGEELEWRYRPEGWSIGQLIHHCADSHMNAFIRFKLALTEENPTIRPYFEDRFAELPDSKLVPIKSSLSILAHLHIRWVVLLKNLTNQDLKRTYVHPEHGAQYPLDDVIGQYAWHCDHHLAHVRQAKSARGKY